jgi:hypothetical protein
MWVELGEVLFRRDIRACVRSDNEGEARPPEFIAVTKEANGFAVWHSYEETRIIAWSTDRNLAIKCAVRTDPGEAVEYAASTRCNYIDIPNDVAELPPREAR